MAGWQELVKRQPSFKGIPFNVKSAETAFGRILQDSASGGSFNLSAFLGGGDTADNKSDSGKRPAVTDNGLMPKKVTVTVEFDGDDYNNTRDAFIAAVEEQGPGKLVLPTYDIYAEAHASKGSVRFSDRRGGVESATVTFVIAGGLTSPTKANDTKGGVKTSAASSKVSGTADFNLNSIVSGIESVFNEVVADIDNMVDSVSAWLSSGAVKADEDVYEQTVESLRDIEANKEVYAADPAAQANAYNDVFDNIGNAFSTAESGFIALIGIASTYAGKIQVVTGAGPQAIARAQNRIAGLIFIQNACISNAALLLSQLNFAAIDDVQGVRDSFGSAVRSLQSTIGSTSGFAETYRDLIRINAAVYNDLVERSAALPVIEERTITTDTPTLNYAYAKYGDADRITEILERNDIKRSLFASGELELLSR